MRAFRLATLASIPERAHLLRRVVEALLPQVDRLGVYLNDYAIMPAFLRHPRIEVRGGPFAPGPDRGDAGKFAWSMEGEDGIRFTCDDDLDYPPDYCDTLEAAIEWYGRRAVVGFHGVIVRRPVEDYYRDRGVLHYCSALPEDRDVHILGTGALAYHTSTIRVDPDGWPRNASDVGLGADLQRARVPRVCLAHTAGWLRSMEGVAPGIGVRASRGDLPRIAEGATRLAAATVWLITPAASPERIRERRALARQEVSDAEAPPSVEPSSAIPVAVEPRPVEGPPVMCSMAAPGQAAFCQGLASRLGFRALSVAAVRAHLDTGAPAIVNGWRPEYAELLDRPGRIWIVWHSGWTGSDIMHEGKTLAYTIGLLSERRVGVLWLERRDLPPPAAVTIAPVWSPADLEALVPAPPPPRRPRSVACALHGSFPSGAKNSLAALSACASVDAEIHLSRSVLESGDPRAVAVRALLAGGVRHVVHETMPRSGAVAVVAACELLVHPSVTETWPYLPMEAIYAGTPVVVTEAIPWAAELPERIRRAAVAPVKGSARLAEIVGRLLDDPDLRAEALTAQRELLDRLAGGNVRETARVLLDCGFPIGSTLTRCDPPSIDAAPPIAARSSRRRKLLLTADVPGWAFDVNLRDLAQYVEGFDFEHWYVVEGRPLPSADAIYVPYLRWREIANMPLERVFGALRSAWFRPETPGPPDPEDVALVNRLRAWHVVTQAAFDAWKSLCPRTYYLTNPVNTRRFEPTHVRDRIVASWTGNARHANPSGQDVKGFHSIVQPACAAADMPLEFAEYSTRRLAPEEMPEFYRRGNVTLCASLYEGASNSVMEAMTAGHAVISTDVGNIREMQDAQRAAFGDSGIAVVERTPEAFTAALRSLTPRRVAEMGALNGREIAERWSWDVWADRYRRFFEDGWS